MRPAPDFDRLPVPTGIGSRRGFTLVEVVMSMAVAGIMIVGLVSGYRQAVRVAEWSAYSLAANSIALQGLERARAAKWDPAGGVDRLQNSYLTNTWEVLDIPGSISNAVYATNFYTFTAVSAAPPLKMVRVDCVWRFFNRGLYTNTVATYRAVDQ
jgi:prepilin-type N-terminal cleavage/methylation domain-containing protein